MYFRSYCEDDAELKSKVIKWFRGEYTTKTEARAALGVGSIIDDDSWYDYIKLWAVFFRRTGYKGFVVMIDECVNLYKIPNRISRENNYEKILAMFNDTMQGRAPGMMIVFGGTPQFLEDSRRGLYSYEALRSRLADNRFGVELRSLMQPVLRLKRLSDSELYALVIRLTALHGEYHKWDVRITEDEMRDFLMNSLSREGADTMITPREIIRDYVTLLDLLYTNEDKTYADIAGSVSRTTVSKNIDEASDGGEEQQKPAEKPKITLDDIEF